MDGKLVGLTLNPDGPRSFFKSMVASYFAPFLASLDDYWEKGYQTGPTKAQLHDRFRGIGGIDMMPNQAFDVGLFAAGFRVPKTAPSGVSLEGSAYELKFLNRHLPGTAAAEREIARGSAHVFNDLSTLSRVESEIFARGIETGSSRGFSRFGLRFDEAIGTGIGRDGTTTALHYGEMKMRSNGLYHIVPRTGPAQ